MENNAYRKLLTLETFQKQFALYLYQTRKKGFVVVKTLKILMFEESWYKLCPKISLEGH